MDTHINLDDSVLAPKRPLSMEPADTEGHMSTPIDDGEEEAPAEDAEGHIVHVIDDAAEGHVVHLIGEDTEGQIWF